MDELQRVGVTLYYVLQFLNWAHSLFAYGLALYVVGFAMAVDMDPSKRARTCTSRRLPHGGHFVPYLHLLHQ